MNHAKSIPFDGSAAAAIKSARAQLIAADFQVQHPSDTELIAKGPGMHSTKQPAILGMTRAQILVSSGMISLDAELGGVKFMWGFICIFPPALMAIMALISALVEHGPNPLLALGPLVPWLVIAPFMARWVKRRTVRAIDVLLDNMASARG